MSFSLGAPSVSTASPASQRARILLIDDEPGLLGAISWGLKSEGHRVEVAADGAAGLRATLVQAYDLVILDLVLPDVAGIEVLRELLRRRPEQAVIVLSALSDPASKVTAFELGADDFLAKPFSMEELQARVRARLRDARSRQTQIAAGVLLLDLVRRRVQDESGRVIQLPEREFLLLWELMAKAGETVSKEQLLATVWGYRFDPGSNVVDVYVRRLRAKLGHGFIKTVRGEGYRIDAS